MMERKPVAFEAFVVGGLVEKRTAGNLGAVALLALGFIVGRGYEQWVAQDSTNAPIVEYPMHMSFPSVVYGIAPKGVVVRHDFGETLYEGEPQGSLKIGDNVLCSRRYIVDRWGRERTQAVTCELR